MRDNDEPQLRKRFQVERQDTDGVRSIGRIVDLKADSVVIDFPLERCADCRCGGDIIGRSAGKPSQVLRFAATALDASASTPVLEEGRLVEMNLPPGRLQLVTATLFGLPLSLGILGCAVAFMAGADPMSQALAALAAMGFGGWASYRLREWLQISVTENLSLRPVDC